MKMKWIEMDMTKEIAVISRQHIDIIIRGRTVAEEGSLLRRIVNGIAVGIPDQITPQARLAITEEIE
jgi:hypothetical protein